MKDPVETESSLLTGILRGGEQKRRMAGLMERQDADTRFWSTLSPSTYRGQCFWAVTGCIHLDAGVVVPTLSEVHG